MDNSSNNPNFSSSPTTNDINANAQPVSAPTPTWLPPQPSLTPPAVEPSTSWPLTPQDHGSTSATSGWNPPVPTSNPPFPNASNLPTSSGFATPAVPTEPLNPPLTNPTWSPATPPADSSVVTPAPAWTSPPAETPMSTPSTTPPIPTPAGLDSTNSSVFPPQFTDPTNPPTPSMEPPAGNSSFDPLAAASLNNPTAFAPKSSTDWPTPPQSTGAMEPPAQSMPATPFAQPSTIQKTPIPTGFSTPQPPIEQITTEPSFVPPIENTTPQEISSPMSNTPVDHQAPTVPDFVNNLTPSPIPPSSGFNLTNSPTNEPPQTSAFNSNPTSYPDTNPTDLSGLGGNPANSSVYTPTVANPEPTPVTPSGIPESVRNTNKPRLSKLIIIGGVVATLLVLASASYLLFLGPKPGSPEDTISLPASGQAPLTKPKVITTPSSATGATATTSASPPNASSSGSSAFDLLRKSTTASPTPTASTR